MMPEFFIIKIWFERFLFFLKEKKINCMADTPYTALPGSYTLFALLTNLRDGMNEAN